MRTRRRPKFTWFPVLGTVVEPDTFNGFPFNLGSPIGEGLGPCLITPLIPDNQKDIATTSDDNLIDFVGSDYLLKRIVGKIYAFASAASGPSGSPPVILFGAGFFVARKDDGDNDRPIGSATTAEASENYGVLQAVNTREPWIWRRTWVLRNRNSTLDFSGGGLESTYTAGSVLDGPHIDAKSARRVRNDERLWLSLQCGTILLDGVDTPAQVDGFVDLRFLGALRKAKNRSAF